MNELFIFQFLVTVYYEVKKLRFQDNCPRGKLPPLRTIPPQKIAPNHKIYPKINCPHSSKFPSKKMITSKLRKAMHCLRVI